MKRETGRRLLLATSVATLVAAAVPALRHTDALVATLVVLSPLLSLLFHRVAVAAPSFGRAIHGSTLLVLLATTAAAAALWFGASADTRLLAALLPILLLGDLLWTDLDARRRRRRAVGDARVLKTSARVAAELRSETFLDSVGEACAEFVPRATGWALYLTDRTELPPQARLATARGIDPATLEAFTFPLIKGVDVLPQAMLTDTLFVVHGEGGRYWCSRDFLLATGLRQFVVLPFRGRDEAPLGALIVAYEGAAPHADDRAALDALRTQLSVALENRLLYERMEEMALRDDLTGLYNARFLRERLRDELKRCRRHGMPLTIALLDLDRFKSFNDTFGHLAGDRALRACGLVMRDLSRAGSVVARYGGEEFVLLAPGATPAQIGVALERLRTGIGGIDIRSERGEPTRPLTVSAGVAAFPADGDNVDALFQTADARLYKAKDAGRDCVVASDDTARPPHRRRRERSLALVAK